MKRYSFLLVISLALLLSCASSCFAIFPKPDFPPSGFGLLSYGLHMGWFNDAEAWYLDFDGSTNDINTARRLGTPFYFLSPKLGSALTPKVVAGDIAARPMYIVLNPDATQYPVFSAVPGDALYSGFWQVHYVTWLPDATKRPITNSNASPFPQGLPSALEATIVATGIVVQFPIVATGPLGGPWYPAPPGQYRMKQVVPFFDYTLSKGVSLPTFTVFCTNPITRRVTRQVITIPDVSDAALADLLGANLAPGLLNVPDGTVDPDENDTQAFWSILSSPFLCQFPVLEQCPLGAGARQINADWTPIVRLTYLNRVGLPPSAVINNHFFVGKLLSSGHLTVADDTQRMGILLFLNQQMLGPIPIDPEPESLDATGRGTRRIR